jgi:hypothetical protein
MGRPRAATRMPPRRGSPVPVVTALLVELCGCNTRVTFVSKPTTSQGLGALQIAFNRIVSRLGRVGGFQPGNSRFAQRHRSVAALPPLVFMHVPKTSGVAIRSGLRIALAPALSIEGFDLSICGSCRDFSSLDETIRHTIHFSPASLLPHADLVCGHSRFPRCGMHTRMPATSRFYASLARACCRTGYSGGSTLTMSWRFGEHWGIACGYRGDRWWIF